MRKFFAVMLLVSVVGVQSLSAQAPQRKGGENAGERPTPEQMAGFQAAKIAAELALGDEASARFVETYKAFKAEQLNIYKGSFKRGNPAEMTEAEVEAKIKAEFETSYKILELREKYYYEFRTFMNPKQIQKMYNLEKHDSSSARSEFNRRQVQGHQGQGARPAQNHQGQGARPAQGHQGQGDRPAGNR